MLITLAEARTLTAAEQVEPLVRIRNQETMDPDDLCFVKTSTGKGVVVVSDKDANTVLLFDEAGKQLDKVAIPQPGNIDMRGDFYFAGDRIPLIVVNQRAEVPQLRALTVREQHGQVRLRLLKTEMPTGPNYGGCLYRGRDDRMYFFSTTKGGLVQQFELQVTGDKIGSRRVRAWESPICEAAVADDANHTVYLAVESVGIRRLGAEPTDPAPGELVLRIGEHGVTGDLVGISLLPTGADSGYLVVFDQDRDRFIVIDRKPPHRFLGELTVRGASHTDGLDITPWSLGPEFPQGAFGCHSDTADGSCVFLVPLPRVREVWQDF